MESMEGICAAVPPKESLLSTPSTRKLLEVDRCPLEEKPDTPPSPPCWPPPPPEAATLGFSLANWAKSRPLSGKSSTLRLGENPALEGPVLPFAIVDDLSELRTLGLGQSRVCPHFDNLGFGADMQFDINGTDLVDTNFDARGSTGRESRCFRLDLVNAGGQGNDAKDAVVGGGGFALKAGGGTGNLHVRPNNLCPFLVPNCADNSTLRGLRKDFAREQHNGEKHNSVQLERPHMPPPS